LSKKSANFPTNPFTNILTSKCSTNFSPPTVPPTYPTAPKYFKNKLELKDALFQGYRDENLAQVNGLRDVTLIYGQIEYWCVDAINNFSGIFSQSFHRFNEDISSWNTSNAISMDDMFAGAEKFNSDLSTWDVGKVKSIRGMFFLQIHSI
jgi:surface protein